jgi:hypothetical protein
MKVARGVAQGLIWRYSSLPHLTPLVGSLKVWARYMAKAPGAPWQHHMSGDADDQSSMSMARQLELTWRIGFESIYGTYMVLCYYLLRSIMRVRLADTMNFFLQTRMSRFTWKIHLWWPRTCRRTWWPPCFHCQHELRVHAPDTLFSHDVPQEGAQPRLC